MTKKRNKKLAEYTTVELMYEIKARVRLTSLQDPKAMVVEVVKIVSEITEVTVFQIMDVSRRPRHTRARALAAYFLCDYLELSLQTCATGIGRDCHTSALYLRNLTRKAIARKKSPQYEHFQLVFVRLIEAGIFVSNDSGKRNG